MTPEWMSSLIMLWIANHWTPRIVHSMLQHLMARTWCLRPNTYSPRVHTRQRMWPFLAQFQGPSPQTNLLNHQHDWVGEYVLVCVNIYVCMSSSCWYVLKCLELSYNDMCVLNCLNLSWNVLLSHLCLEMSWTVYIGLTRKLYWRARSFNVITTITMR